jgi:PTS system nitrogen regulatory IIA component
MPSLTGLLDPERVIARLEAASKRDVLRALARSVAGRLGRHEREILDVLWQREQLGSTATGHGTALPHAKLAGLDRVFGLFARLAAPVEFEARDGQPGDLVFLLLAPVGAGADHLDALAQISRVFRDAAVRTRLRKAKDAAALYARLAEAMANSEAA